MSRRRISVKDLGVVDCQGWMQRKKEGRSFSRCVYSPTQHITHPVTLTTECLHSSHRNLSAVFSVHGSLHTSVSYCRFSSLQDEKAEGFINLSGFTIEQAKQCRKKHAITASHPLVVTIFIATETFTEMNKWISKMSEAAQLSEVINAEECYSEDSDQDGDECASICSQDSEQETPETENGDVAQPLCESSPCTSCPPSTTPTTHRRRSSSEGSCRTRGAGSDGSGRQSWPQLPRNDAASGAASVPLVHVEEETEEDATHEKPPDELETLYNDLKAASLSVTGQSSRRDFRASFIRRCQNDKVNDKLHQFRILSSTLKDKQSELQAVEQILTDPTLTAANYRKWRLSNHILLQEISKCSQAVGGATELMPPEQPSG